MTSPSATLTSTSFLTGFSNRWPAQPQDVPALQAKLGWHVPPIEPESLAEAWATELNRHGVAKAAIIASTPGDEASVLAAANAYAESVLASRDGEPDGGARHGAPGLKAVCLFPAMHRYSLHDPRAETVIERPRRSIRPCSCIAAC